MTLQQFVLAFPEFAETLPTLIDSKLALASARMGGPDASVWGPFAGAGAPIPSLTLADSAQGNLAAHYLVTNPFGTQLAQAASDATKKTSYLQVFEDLQLAVGGGFLVAGVPATA